MKNFLSSRFEESNKFSKQFPIFGPFIIITMVISTPPDFFGVIGNSLIVIVLISEILRIKGIINFLNFWYGRILSYLVALIGFGLWIVSANPSYFIAYPLVVGIFIFHILKKYNKWKRKENKRIF